MATIAERMESMKSAPQGTQKDVRHGGKVLGTLPDRGFFWIKGDDGKKYFAHQTKVKGGFLIYDMWEGQRCSFVAKFDDGRGPRAEEIEMSNA